MWVPPRQNHDASRITSYHLLNKVVDAIYDKPSLDHLLAAFTNMRGYKQEEHPLHEDNGGWVNVRQIIADRMRIITKQ